VSGKIQDTSDLVDKFSDAMIDVKDKATSRLSDIQLRTPNEAVKQYSTTLSTPVNSEQWNDEVSQKILWFASRNIQTAEMHLNPAELGPIDVKVHVQNDVTTVTFNVNNASVRDLLESNVVRLREMMEANGVNLGDVNVDSGSRDQSQQSGTDSNNKGSGQSGQEMDENGELVATENVVTLKQSNLVDYFV
jgi:flagellar hook-length control protein FliK